MKKHTLAIYIFCTLFVFILFSIGEIYAQENEKTPPLKVTLLSVHDGDAILIQTPSGKVILIDGGMPRLEDPETGKVYSYFDGGLHVIIPFLKENDIKELDYVILTHPDADHVGGLVSVLREVPVKNVIATGVPKTTRIYQSFIGLIDEKKIPYRQVREGDILEIDELLFFQVLSPSDNIVSLYGSAGANNTSIVIKLIYNKISFLLTADIEKEVENSLLAYGDNLKSTFLKVPHHGSTTSSTPRFIQMVDPEFSLISVGKNSKFGFPKEETLVTLASIGTTIYATGRNGNITVITDGDSYEVKVEHGEPYDNALILKGKVVKKIPVAVKTPMVNNKKISPNPDEEKKSDGKVNINTASGYQLQKLPRITKRISERIIEYREKHGPFKSVDDLDNVAGLGSKTLDAIRPYIVVE